MAFFHVHRGSEASLHRWQEAAGMLGLKPHDSCPCTCFLPASQFLQILRFFFAPTRFLFFSVLVLVKNLRVRSLKIQLGGLGECILLTFHFPRSFPFGGVCIIGWTPQLPGPGWKQRFSAAGTPRGGLPDALGGADRGRGKRQRRGGPQGVGLGVGQPWRAAADDGSFRRVFCVEGPTKCGVPGWWKTPARDARAWASGLVLQLLNCVNNKQRSAVS